MTQDEIIEMARKAGFFINDELTITSPFIEDICISPMLKEFAKLVVAKAFPHGVDAEWIARRTKYAVEQERANNALLCYQQRKHWDALACSDAIRAGIRARGEQHEQQ